MMSDRRVSYAVAAVRRRIVGAAPIIPAEVAASVERQGLSSVARAHDGLLKTVRAVLDQFSEEPASA
jgi:hypothetical protein